MQRFFCLLMDVIQQNMISDRNELFGKVAAPECTESPVQMLRREIRMFRCRSWRCGCGSTPPLTGRSGAVRRQRSIPT